MSLDLAAESLPSGDADELLEEEEEEEDEGVSGDMANAGLDGCSEARF